MEQELKVHLKMVFKTHPRIKELINNGDYVSAFKYFDDNHIGSAYKLLLLSALGELGIEITDGLKIGEREFCSIKVGSRILPKHIILPRGVTSIDKYAFMHLDIESIVIPEGVSVIGSGAFYACEKLKSVIIPDSVQGSVGVGIFSDCDMLESISLPSYMKNWGPTMLYTRFGANDLNVIKFR